MRFFGIEYFGVKITPIKFYTSPEKCLRPDLLKQSLFIFNMFSYKLHNL